MKQLYIFLVSVLAVLGLVACTADYDEFGASHYKVFKDIVFEEQDGDASVSADEHIIRITTVAPAESLETWDSLTISYFSASNLATLHLVDGKFKEFPSDSAGLDSLAQEVSYVKKNLRAGDKIRIPKSQVVYVMLVAENGDPAIWKIEFTIPGVEKEESSSSAGEDDSGKSSSSEGEDDSAESSSSVAAEQSSSSIEIAKNDDNSFKIKFVDELDNKTSGDTVYVTFAQGTELAKVVVDSTVAFINRLAKIDVDPKSVKDWSIAQTFKVTAENDSAKTWTVVVAAVKSSATNLTLKFNNQVATSTKVGEAADTIFIKLKDDETIEGAKLDLEASSVSVGATVSPALEGFSDWAESVSFKVTAEDGTEKTWILCLSIAEKGYVASSENELIAISAEGQVAEATVDAEAHKVVLHMAKKDDMASVAVTIKVSDKASFVLEDRNLLSPKKLTITAEDGSSVEWTVSADYVKSAAAEVLKFAVSGLAVSEEPTIDAEKSTITFEVEYGSDLKSVVFSASVSEFATFSDQPLDLSSGSAKLVVTAESGETKEWTIVANVAEPPKKPAPRILSMKIAGKDAVVDSVEENGKWIHWVHYDNLEFMSDLSNLKVSDIKLSDGATIDGIVDGKSYDLVDDNTVTVSNGEESLKYAIRAGYQYLNNDFNTWKQDEFKANNDVEGWDNGNNSYAKTLTASIENQTIVKMQSVNAVIKFASGNLFTGVFNPKGVQTMLMANYKDGNELIDFGRPFAARPRYVEFDVKYELPAGKKDSCDLYVVLENRTSTRTCDSYDAVKGIVGSNACRTSSDVNTMVASAWYRATTVDSYDDPDVVSIKDAAQEGYKTIRMKLHYGVPLDGSPLYESSALSTTLVNSKGVDNHVVTTDHPENFAVTHVRIAMASSADGNHYNGTINATLYADEMRFIY